MNLETLFNQVESAKSDLIRRRANKQSLEAIMATEKSDCARHTEEVNNLVDSIAVLQNFSSGIRTDIVAKFEDLITSGVKEVFNKEYRVAIEFSTSGNSYHADFYVYLPDGKKINLHTGEGGGLKDFISVLQRMLYIILEPTKPSKVMFLDENLKALDAGRAATAFRFLSGLAKELDIQVVMITHSTVATSLLNSGSADVVELSDDGQQVYAKKMEPNIL